MGGGDSFYSLVELVSPVGEEVKLFAGGQGARIVDPLIRDSDESVDGVGVALNFGGEFFGCEVVRGAKFSMKLFADGVVVGRGEVCWRDIDHRRPQIFKHELTCILDPRREF